MKKIYIIINPFGGNGQGLPLCRAFAAFLKNNQIDFSVYKTEHQGHARELAARITFNKDSLLVVMGGDGTLFEVINGLMLNPSDNPTLATLPTGSSNFLAQSLNMPLKNTETIFSQLLQARKQTVDMVKVSHGETHVYSIAAMTCGFFVELLAISERLRFLGVNRYFYASFKAIFSAKKITGQLNIDNGRIIEDGIFTTLVIYNTPYQGRDLIFDTDAKIDDGLWHIAYSRQLSKAALTQLLYQVRFGQWKKNPKIKRTTFKELTFNSKASYPFNTDG